MIEMTVTIKDSESTYKQKFLIYEPCLLSEDDVHIKECIDEALEAFGKAAESITLKLTLEVSDSVFFVPTIEELPGAA